ncbi:hypothetical protein PPL_10532 [Heterostelium album PN500]|uniref:MACPF domain-containing protein n=1 Tax=Heterostelium pallidum (strain ATCC 26659 / Pp 5 / PN500) TaxID=670386 RepID=D3BRC4_HETP5|nr:hypothetical protein PPL_10532 [Heterostelium album PN500]EFA75956.1 hypothetical protein PPL_10532 [Heterostelium album PN500]|eukprot:XP_020428090.1 hypothetical protein PPL_10532 [Heterostelium album PN500]
MFDNFKDDLPCLNSLYCLSIGNHNDELTFKDRDRSDIVDYLKNIKPKDFTVVPLLSNVKYTGFSNDIDIVGLNLFFSSNDKAPVTIDCKSNGRAFNITAGSEVTFYNIIFTNCSNSLGAAIHVSDDSTVFFEKVLITNSISDFGALYVSNSKVIITSSNFTFNKAYQDGSAIYATNGAVIELDNIRFTGNSRIVKYNGNDFSLTNDISIYKRSSVLSKDEVIPDANIFSICDTSSSFINMRQSSLCSIQSKLEYSVFGICNDSICDPVREDFFNCPEDCPSTFFSGFLHQEFQCKIKNKNDCGEKPIHREPLSFARLTPFKNQDSEYNIMKGQLESYFRVPRDGNIHFKFKVENINLYVYLDNNPIIEFDGSQNNLFYGDKDLTVSKYLVSDHVHKIKIIYEVIARASFGQRNLEIKYSLDGISFKLFEDINFYSYMICGDGIYDPNEDCDSDSNGGYGTPFSLKKGTGYAQNGTTCGNGICDEVDPNSCIYDCYKYITPRCAPYTMKQGSIPPMETSMDTLGLLIQNQMIWRLPGYQHFSFGYDIVFGEQRSYPIFYFGFCNEKESNIVEDKYRQTFYEVPKELSVIPLPKCTFDVVSKFHSTVEKMRNEMALKSTASTTSTLNGGAGSVEASVSVAFSKDRSIQNSMQMESKVEGTLIESTIDCYITSVKLNEFQFSLNFLRDIATAITFDEYFSLVETYGTHYYDSAILGGQLKHTTSINEKDFSTERENEIAEQTTKSVSAKVSSPKFNVKASYSGSDNSVTSEKSMEEYNQKTSKSSIIAKGGAPGSYGTSAEGKDSTFGGWADTIDYLPVPIDPQLKRIAEIIPKTWKTPQGKRVFDLWYAAEQKYYELEGGLLQSRLSLAKSNTFVLWMGAFASESKPFNTPVKLAMEVNVKGSISTVDFQALRKEFGTNQFDIQNINRPFDFQYITPTFKVNWTPSSNSVVKLVSSMKSKKTFVEKTKRIGFESNITHIENMVFMNVGETTKFPNPYLWDADKYDSYEKDYNILKPYFFDDNGVLIEPTISKDSGYLLIPPMPMAYKSIAINIHTGGYVTVLYVDYNVSINQRQLISIPQEHLAKILVATSIDYTPNYENFHHLGESYSWYNDDDGPTKDYWYWHKTQNMRPLFAKLAGKYGNDQCPMAINYDNTCNLEDCLSGDRLQSITSIFIPVGEPTYFFLPNKIVPLYSESVNRVHSKSIFTQVQRTDNVQDKADEVTTKELSIVHCTVVINLKVQNYISVPAGFDVSSGSSYSSFWVYLSADCLKLMRWLNSE